MNIDTNKGERKLKYIYVQTYKCVYVCMCMYAYVVKIFVEKIQYEQKKLEWNVSIWYIWSIRIYGIYICIDI